LTNDSTTEARQRAETKFKKKEMQAREGAKAMADYMAQGKVVAERTARLREARLAKEAADKVVADEKAALKKALPKSKAATAASGTAATPVKKKRKSVAAKEVDA
jgi:RecA/RadA recombinase